MPWSSWANYNCLKKETNRCQAEWQINEHAGRRQSNHFAESQFQAMTELPAPMRMFSIIAAAMFFLLPVLSHAEGISIMADLEYFLTQENSTDKTTGNVSDTEFSRFSQLYRLDLTRQLYPNLLFMLGGNYENDDTSSQIQRSNLPEISGDTAERTIRPYVSVDLKDPIYRANLGYRTRDVKTSRSVGDENLMVDEYSGFFNWRPVDLPLFTVNYRRTEIQDDPLTIDSTNDVVNLLSRYTYRDFRFQYSFSGNDTYNNIEDTGNLVKTHNGRVDYHRGFDYLNNRFDIKAAARIIQSSVDFTGSVSGDETVDAPAAELGTPFYILNDSTPAHNEPFDLILVEGGNTLTSINIGRGGGINPVSAGLSFGIPTEVTTIYIQLSNDDERFPDLASASQVAEIAPLLRWHFYTSDDQLELNWTENTISSATYNSIDNRFEIRLSSPVSARRIKVTTTPLTLIAPGEIRYQSIRAFTNIGGSADREPENLDQGYSLGIGWTPNVKTTMGYDVSYRTQESEPGGSKRSSWTNSLYYRHILSQIYSTYGRFYYNGQTRSSLQGTVDDTDYTYSIGLRGDYLATLSQSLIFTGSESDRSGGTTDTKSLLLRTNADLYTGWSMSIDLGYSLNTLRTGGEQDVKSFYLATTMQPNRRIDINLDYSAIWTEETDRTDSLTQYGTFQILWVITDTLNTFISYNFRDLQAETDTTAYSREFSVNWAPFPDGDLRFAIGYTESTDDNQEVKSISPSLTWKIARGIFLDLRYDTGTLETQTELSDYNSYIVKFRLFY